MGVGRRCGYAGVASVLAAAALWLPATAGATTTCELSSGLLDVTMSAGDDSVRMGVVQGGSDILVLDNGTVNCAGAAPTVNNTNTISVHNAPGLTNNDVTIYEAARFAPGATVEVAEMGGTPEIEIFVNLNDGAGSRLDVDTPFAGGAVVFGTGGINPNATGGEVAADADITPSNVPLLAGRGNPGPDLISAGGGLGTVGPLPVSIDMAAGAGNDTVVGGDGGDVIDGGQGSDSLSGGGGPDVIDGGPDANVFLSGAAGNDRLVPGSASDSVSGEGGTDEVDFSVHLTTGVSIDLLQNGIENVVGTNFADVLRGDNGPNVLLGLQGNDVLEGRGGEDEIGAGPGDDFLQVRDGGPDIADCGPDADAVTADAPGIDALTSCERATFPAVDGNGQGLGADIAPDFLGSPTAEPARFRVASKGPAEQPVSLARKGTTFRYTLSEAATVTLEIKRRTAGRRVKGECVKKTPANASRKKCALFKRVGAFHAPGVAGENAKPFSGLIGKKALRPGSYRASLTAVDVAGNQSQPAHVRFTVLPPRRGN